MKKLAKILPFIFTLCIVLWFNFSRYDLLKLYPILANSFVFLIFFTSLFQKETVIQKIAKKCEGKELDKFTRTYTKNLTYVWTVFLAINVFLAIATAFMSDKIWMWYNGCVSYLLLGIFFAVEYIVRIIIRGKQKA